MNDLQQVSQSHLHPKPLEASNSNGSAARSATSGATVTANDFLTLLVTELKNQDPTADTDPNAYVNQLVQVNSLQQLIQINGGLSGLSSSQSGQSAASQVRHAASGLIR